MTVPSGDRPLFRGKRSRNFPLLSLDQARRECDEAKGRKISFSIQTSGKPAAVLLALVFFVVVRSMGSSSLSVPPRVIFLNGSPTWQLHIRRSSRNSSTKVPPEIEETSSYSSDDTQSCPYIADWQRATSPRPTCNSLHEIGPPRPSGWIDSGAYRDVWSVNDDVVLKMQVFKSDYEPSNLVRHYKDALVMHETTASPYILNLYSYCAFSSMVESAQDTIHEWIDEEENHSPQSLLRVATHMALGLAHVHLYTNGLPTFAHADLKASQYLVISTPQDPNHPIVKLNDFNRGRFLTARNQTSCPFYISTRHRGSTNRSPEEYQKDAPQSDKIDVFSLGSTMYHLLTGNPPFHDLKFKDAKEKILNGVQPPLPNVTDPDLVTLMTIIQKCRQFRPDDRPTSREVADWLQVELNKLDKTRSKS